MAVKKWNDLSSQQKTVTLAVAAADAALRLWAGRDLASRPASRVNGPRWLWGAGLSAISSAGILPIAYLIVGRKRISA